MEKNVIRQYFNVLSTTRLSGKISDSVLKREVKYWEQFSTDVVIEALRIHISKYQDNKETYTRGIMRNLQAQGFRSKTFNNEGLQQQSKDRQEELRKELQMLAQKKQKRREQMQG